MMALVFLAFATVWGIGWAMGAPLRQRLAAVGGLWSLVVLALLLLPEGPVRAALGGDARPWLVLGALLGLGLAYRAGLGWLRARAPQAVTPEASTFSEAELRRYSRHLLLREIGGPGQQRLKQARVLVIGAGGLGSPICLYLAASGVGTITVIDPDRIESSNLQRQII
ncbi:MAG: ThiF family adenylyltransferase, partial [Gemmobacter sp.]|uniref:HesA/MoeB/ThiF family protein n=1 Tax=Gemmobacter sp. TaxID=1898957 RepID=UPI001A609FAF